jgi:hypothetical protein
MSGKLFVGGSTILTQVSHGQQPTKLCATVSLSLAKSFRQESSLTVKLTAPVGSDVLNPNSVVEFADVKDAEKAVDGLRDQDLDGRTIRVDFANEKPPRRDRDDYDRPSRREGNC